MKGAQTSQLRQLLPRSAYYTIQGSRYSGVRTLLHRHLNELPSLANNRPALGVSVLTGMELGHSLMRIPSFSSFSFIVVAAGRHTPRQG